MSQISSQLLEVLACPSCKSKVSLQGNKLICTNASCKLKFPVRDGIPVMIIEEASKD